MPDPFIKGNTLARPKDSRIDNKVFRPIPLEAEPFFKHLEDLNKISPAEATKLKRLVGSEDFIVGLVIFKSYLADKALGPIGQVKRDKRLDEVFLCLLSSEKMINALNEFKGEGSADPKITKIVGNLIDYNGLFVALLADKSERDYRAHRMERQSRTSPEQTDYSNFLSSFFISFEEAIRQSNLQVIKGFLGF